MKTYWLVKNAICRRELIPILWISSLVVSVLIVALLAFSTFWSPTRLPPWNPLQEYTLIQRVKNPDKLVRLSVSPVVVVAGRKCNVLTRPIQVTGHVHLLRIENGSNSKPVVLWPSSERVRPPGCKDHLWNNPLPVDLDPGVWILTGQDIAIDDEGLNRFPDVEVFETEPFMVVP